MPRRDRCGPLPLRQEERRIMGFDGMRLVHQIVDDPDDWHDQELLSPFGSAIVELLDGERGSLPELTERFAKAGLDRIMASWIGDQAPLPISAAELRHVLGERRVEDLATLAGMESEVFLQRLAQVLPAEINVLVGRR